MNLLAAAFKMTLANVVLLSVGAAGALSSAAQQLIGDSERIVQILSNPVPLTAADLQRAYLFKAKGPISPNRLIAQQAIWKEAMINLLSKPLFRSAVHVETAFLHSGQAPERLQRSIAAHLDSQARGFYHLGGDMFLSKVGPETQQAETFFTKLENYRASEANSAILIWWRDSESMTDPRLITAAGFRIDTARGTTSWHSNPLRQIQDLDRYVLLSRANSQHYSRLDDFEKHRVLVPRNRHDSS